MENNAGEIFITGGSGYIGSRLIPRLLDCGLKVTALVRAGSEKKIDSRCNIVIGNALDSSTYSAYVKDGCIFIHLVGVAHPGPGKEKEFLEIDMVSIEEAVKTAKSAGASQFIYLSVAEPAPVMKEFIEVRKYGERLLAESGLNAVFIKPWYVLGPGHYWPYLLLPFYLICMLIPPLSTTARRLYPVKLDKVLNAIVDSVKYPVKGIRSISTDELRKY
ncbi:MAG: NAD-dependent epimerase/dehydratase family protein [Ignavibacteria bacterium]|nr:NAD-dependent epimerase/dehydratase family protein [Ignavibacteria bacterium]